MCHTRELAFQISKEYQRFSKYMPSVKVSMPGPACLGSGPAGIYQAWLRHQPLRSAVVSAP